jgi:N-acetylmuramoyl-L-alanine amidase
LEEGIKKMKMSVRTVFLTLTLLGLFSFALGSSGFGGIGTSTKVHASPQSWWDDLELLSRIIMGEAMGEPFMGQVAVGAVVINRTRSPEFPNTVAGVMYEPDAFESVTNGLVWSNTPLETEVRAAELALNGWDPTGGALFFWNPSKPVGPWIWTRPIILQIGDHVFAY